MSKKGRLLTSRFGRAVLLSCVCVLISWSLMQGPALAVPLNVSDPATYVAETFSDTVGWRFGSPYPTKRTYSFFSGAEGSLELSLTSPYLRFLGLALLDASGKVVSSRDLYYKGSPYWTSFYLRPGYYTVLISGDVWGAYADSISYVLTLKHPQSAPQIELSFPANTAMVSHTVEVSVEKKDIPSNPEIASLDVFLAGSPVASFSAPPYSFPLNTDIYANTYHQLEFRAYDEAGRYNPLTSWIEVKNVSPDTQTESFRGRIGWGSSLLYPRSKEYAFEMRRAGGFNAVISGDWRIRLLGWIVRDSSGNKVHYHDFYYDGTYVRRSIYLSQGSYTLTIFDMGFWPQTPYIPYILTLDYPAKRKIIEGLVANPSTVDPSEVAEDTASSSTAISYSILESAHLTLEVRDEEGNLTKTLLSNSSQVAGAHLSGWDGLDDQGNIADEGQYTITLKSFDDKGFLLDSASTPVEVLYHMDL